MNRAEGPTDLPVSYGNELLPHQRVDTSATKSLKQEREVFNARKHKVTNLYLLNPDKSHVLMLFHKKFGLWLPPGGHVDDELPHEAAARELYEETGITDLTICNLEAGKLHIASGDQRQLSAEETVGLVQERMIKPFAIIEETVPLSSAHPESGHTYLDYTYVGQTHSPTVINMKPRESGDFQWLPLEDEAIENLHTFGNVRAVLKKMKELTRSNLLGMEREEKAYDSQKYTFNEHGAVNTLKENSATYAAMIQQRYAPGSKLRPLKLGNLCEVFLMEPRTEGERRVIKLLPFERLAQAEAELLTKWKSVGIPVPAIHRSDFSRSEIPFPYMMLEYVENDDMKFSQYSVDQKKAILEETVGHLKKAHQEDEKYFGWMQFDPSRQGDGSWTETVQKLVDGRGRVLVERGIVPEEAMRSFRSAILNLTQSVETASLLHGDMRIANLLCRDGKLASIIDPDPIGGDGLYDVAYLSTSNEDLRSGIYDQLLLETYLSHSATESDLAKWDAYRGLALIRQTIAALKKRNDAEIPGLKIAINASMDSFIRAADGK